MSDDPYMDWIRKQAARPRYAFGIAVPIVELVDADPDRKMDKETELTGTDLDTGEAV